MKRKVYTSRGQKEGDFWAGFFIFPALVLGVPPVLGTLVQGPAQVLSGPILGIAFLIVAGIYRPWMAIGALGCVGALLALGLFAAIFLAVVCSSGFR